jgi:hypothetical protein
VRRLTAGHDRLPQPTARGTLFVRESNTSSVRLVTPSGAERVLASSPDPVFGYMSHDARTVAISRIDSHDDYQPTELVDLDNGTRRRLPWAVLNLTFSLDDRYLLGDDGSKIIRYPTDGAGQPQVLGSGYYPTTVPRAQPAP